jgi:DNA-binding SARP family transcriptional activator
VIPQADLIRLVRGAELSHLDSVRIAVTGNLTAALERAEVELLHRSRLLEQYGVPTIDQLRAADSEDEDLPTVVLIAAVETESAARLEAILARGPECGLSAVLLGDWPSGATVDVQKAGLVRAVGGRRAGRIDAEGAQLFTMSAAELTPLLTLLEAAVGEPVWPELESEVVAEEHEPAEEDDIVDVDVHDDDLPDEPSTDPAEPSNVETELPVAVRLFGPVIISVGGAEIRTGLRRDARNLLVYLLTHPDGARGEAIEEDLWPRRDPAKVSGLFHTARKNLRDVVRRATAHPELDVVLAARATERFALEDTIFTSDWDDFYQALAEARTSTDIASRLAAYRRAIDAYGGLLAEDMTFTWLDALRSAARRDVLDACSHLVGLAVPNQPQVAIAALEKVIAIEPVEESLYRNLMRAQAAAGADRDTILRTLTLAEDRVRTLLDTDLDPETIQVANDLTA